MMSEEDIKKYHELVEKLEMEKKNSGEQEKEAENG